MGDVNALANEYARLNGAVFEAAREVVRIQGSVSRSVKALAVALDEWDRFYDERVGGIREGEQRG
jgi:hypothetical protein